MGQYDSAGDAALAALSTSQAAPIDVYDGDTFTEADGTRTRIDGVDTPELKDRRDGAIMGNAIAARDALQALNESGYNEVVSTGEVDKYGRSLGDLQNSAGDMASTELLKAGLAVPNYSDNEEQRQAYAAGAWRSNFDIDQPSIINPEVQGVLDRMESQPFEHRTDQNTARVLDVGPDGDFSRGLATGVASTKALIGGIGALMGIEGGREYYQEQTDIAQAVAPRVSRIEDINGVGDFVDWMQGSVGQALPTMLPVIVGGGAGGLIGRAAAKRAIQSQMQKRLAMQLTGKVPMARAKQILGDASVNQLMKRSATGGYGGAWLANSAMQSSGIYNELLDSGIDDRATSIVFGAAAGAVETAADVLLFKRLFPNGADHEITDLIGLSKRIGQGMVEQGIAEGGAEGASQAIQLAAHAYADPSFDFWSVQTRSELMNAAAAGAAAGLVFGAATETIGATSDIKWGDAKTKDDVPVDSGPNRDPGVVDFATNPQPLDEQAVPTPEQVAEAPSQALSDEQEEARFAALFEQTETQAIGDEAAGFLGVEAQDMAEFGEAPEITREQRLAVLKNIDRFTNEDGSIKTVVEYKDAQGETRSGEVAKPVRDFLMRLAESKMELEAEKDTNPEIISKRVTQAQLEEVTGAEIDDISYDNVEAATDALLRKELDIQGVAYNPSESDAQVAADGKNMQELDEVDAMRDAIKERVISIIGGRQAFISAERNPDDTLRVELPLKRRGQPIKNKDGSQQHRRINLIEVVTLGETLNGRDNMGKSRKQSRVENLSRGLEALGSVGDGKVQLDIGDAAAIAEGIIGLERGKKGFDKPVTLNTIEEQNKSAAGRPENITAETTERTKPLREFFEKFEQAELRTSHEPGVVADDTSDDLVLAEAIQAQIDVERDRLFVERTDKELAEGDVEDWKLERYVAAKTSIKEANAKAAAAWERTQGETLPSPQLIMETGRWLAQDRRDRGRKLSALDEGQMDVRREAEFNAETEDGSYHDPEAFGDDRYDDGDKDFNIEMSRKSTDAYRRNTGHDRYQASDPAERAAAYNRENGPNARAALDDQSESTAHLRDMVDNFREVTGLKLPVRVSTVSKMRGWLADRTSADFTLFTENKGEGYAPTLAWEIASFIERGTKGMSLTIDIDGQLESFIVINDEIDLSPAEEAWILAHEFGHTLQRAAGDMYKNSDNTVEQQLYSDLRRDFSAWHKDANAAVKAYGKEHGMDKLFDEWLASQFGAWVTEKFGGVALKEDTYTKAQQTYFTKLVAKLRKLYNGMKQFMKSHGELAPSFSEFMAQVAYNNFRESTGPVVAAQFTTARPGNIDFTPEMGFGTPQHPRDPVLPRRPLGMMHRERNAAAWEKTKNPSSIDPANRENAKTTRTLRPARKTPAPSPNAAWGGGAQDFIELSHFSAEKVKAHANKTKLGRASVKAYGKVSPIAKTLSDLVTPTIRKTLGTSAHLLRHFGMNSIADQLPRYYGSVQQHIGIYSKQFHDIMGDYKDDEAGRAAYAKLAEELRGRGESTAEGRKLRKLLDSVHAYYNEAIPGEAGGIGYVEDFYPGAFDREKLGAEGARAEFISEVSTHLEEWSNHEKAGLDESQADIIANEIYEKLIGNEQVYNLEESPKFLGTAAQATHARTALSKIPALDKFRGDNPAHDVLKYIKEMVHRGEQGRLWGQEIDVETREGAKYKVYEHTALIDQAAVQSVQDGKMTPEQYRYVKTTVWPALMGNLHADIDPTMRKSIGYMMMYQNFRTLLFATLSSLSDVGLIINRSGGDFGLAFSAFKEAVLAKRTQSDLVDMAELLGLMGTHATQNLLHNMYDGAYMGDSRIDKMNDMFFRAIQLQRWTDFTRIMGLSAGMKFVDKHINSDSAKSKRWMAEMNVDRAAYKRWRQGGSEAYGANGRTVAAIQRELSMADPSGVAALEAELAKAKDALSVSQSLTQFVNTASLNPNASQRPAWASDPRWALFWHLKQFMYTMQTQVVDRAYKEMKASIKDGDSEQVIRNSLSALSLLPFAAAGLVIRNALQYGIFGEEPPEDRQASLDAAYLMQLLERSGGAGVGMLVFDAAEATDRGGYTLLSPLGPTVSQLQSFLDASEEDTDMLLRGKSNEIMKAIPGPSQSYPLRKKIAGMLE